MDRDLLDTLAETLSLLLEARCHIESEAALITAVNGDLAKVLRRLKARASKQEQQLPTSASRVVAQHSQPNLAGTRSQQQQWHQPAATAGQTVPGNTVGQQPMQAALATVPATKRPAPKGSSAMRGRQQPQMQAVRRPVSAASSLITTSAGAKQVANRKSASASALQQPTASAAVAAAAASAQALAAALAPLPAPGVPPSVPTSPTQQPDGGEVLLTDLPAGFRQLLLQYSELQQQVCDAVSRGAQQHTAPVLPHTHDVTSSAAAGFLDGLQQHYAFSKLNTLQAAQQQQQQHMPPLTGNQACLSVLQYCNQAQYVGLAAAALWAVQLLKAPRAESYGSYGSLYSLVPAVMQQCEQWLQCHSQQQQQQQHCQREGSTCPPVSDTVEATVRWRNRCLRSLLATSGTVAAAAAAAPASAGSSTSTTSGMQGRAAGQLPVWLPQQTWQLLQAFQAGTGCTSSMQASSSSEGSAVYGVLSPTWQLQQQRVASIGSRTRLVAATVQPEVCLCYSELQDLALHSRNIQKLQQLLLHLHIESRLAPKLVECLLRGCVALSQAGDAAGQQQPPGQPASAMSRAAGGDGVTRERCLGLYRLLHMLTAAAAKQRGLGGSCHIAERVVGDASLLQLDQ